jgi:hypothetical protein
MKYFAFLALVFSFQNSNAKMVNIPGKHTRDSTKLEVQSKCNNGNEVSILFNNEPIVISEYEHGSCQDYYKKFKERLNNARNLKKKMMVDTDVYGNTDFTISEEDNRPQMTVTKPGGSMPATGRGSAK